MQCFHLFSHPSCFKEISLTLPFPTFEQIVSNPNFEQRHHISLGLVLRRQITQTVGANNRTTEKILFWLYFHYYLSSVHYCEARFHIYFIIYSLREMYQKFYFKVLDYKERKKSLEAPDTVCHVHLNCSLKLSVNFHFLSHAFWSTHGVLSP